MDNVLWCYFLMSSFSKCFHWRMQLEIILSLLVIGQTLPFIFFTSSYFSSSQGVFRRFCEGLTKIETLMKERGHSYMWNEHLGYVLTCPSNLGTGLRAGVHVKLAAMSKDEKKLDKVLNLLRLQKVRGERKRERERERETDRQTERQKERDRKQRDRREEPFLISPYSFPPFHYHLHLLHLHHSPLQRGTGGVDTASDDGTYDISNADRIGYSEVDLLQFVCDGVALLIEMEKLAAEGKPYDALIPAVMKK